MSGRMEWGYCSRQINNRCVLPLCICFLYNLFGIFSLHFDSLPFLGIFSVIFPFFRFPSFLNILFLYFSLHFDCLPFLTFLCAIFSLRIKSLPFFDIFFWIFPLPFL